MLCMGSARSEIREMDIDDIFTARLKLLIIMAKAYLKDCDQGKRCFRAMMENAQHVQSESIDLGGLHAVYTCNYGETERIGLERAYFQKIQQLAVMIKSITRGIPIDAHRKTVLQENLDMICETLGIIDTQPKKNDLLIPARVMIIDDDPFVRDFAVHAIEFVIDRQVMTCDSGFKAWQFIASQADQVDIIIADANIPEIDGLQLLERVKRDYPSKIYMLLSSDPETENRAKQLKADAVLLKPLDAEVLLTIIEQFGYNHHSSTETAVVNINSKRMDNGKNNLT